jgi:hypothetical protein
MSYLTQIERRHGHDGWLDAGFLAVAGLLVALAIGAVTMQAAGTPTAHEWTVTVVESGVELAK